MKSTLGIPVVDAHSHFFTANTLRSWLRRGRTLEGFSKRTRKRTNMKEIELPGEDWDTAGRWVDELDQHGVQAIGFMVGSEAYDEFLEAKKRFPGRFLGYTNITPGDVDAVERVRQAAKDGFYGIKLYPSAWSDYHTYDEVCYPVYEEASRHDLLVFLHFGITIGGQADLRHGNPIDIQLPSRDFPDLRFIIAHFGAGWFREALLLQYQADNIYMDSSGSNSWMNYLPYDLDLKQVFRKAIQAGGSEKVLFGTDSTFFPRGFRINIMEAQFKALKELALESNPIICEDDIDRIMRRNILEMTGFEPSMG